MITIEQLIEYGIPARNAPLLLRRLRVKPSGCWEWLGAKNSEQRPIFGVRKDGKQANYIVGRIMYAIEHPGRDITSQCVVPLCKDVGCVRPEHLTDVSRGEARVFINPEARLGKHIGWDTVSRIRRMPLDTNWKEFSREVGLASSTVRLIRQNKTWRTDECYVPHIQTSTHPTKKPLTRDQLRSLRAASTSTAGHAGRLGTRSGKPAPGHAWSASTRGTRSTTRPATPGRAE